MEFYDLALKGLKLMIPKICKDARGYFFEAYRKSDFLKAGIDCDFVQDNQSFSSKNIIRGMHFQAGKGQAKLVRVAYGRIYDVAVDIRPDSPTFGCWQGVYLDDEEHKSLFIPEGFAHGFCVLSETAQVVYSVSQYYDSGLERGFRYDDSEVNIAWPISHPILSERDVSLPSFRRTLLVTT